MKVRFKYDTPGCTYGVWNAVAGDVVDLPDELAAESIAQRFTVAVEADDDAPVKRGRPRKAE